MLDAATSPTVCDGPCLVATRSRSRENDNQLFSNTLAPLRYPKGECKNNTFCDFVTYKRQKVWYNKDVRKKRRAMLVDGKDGNMKPRITLNEDKEIVATVKQGLKERGGYCPCRFEKTEENKCICKEFRDQIADPDFEGYCHCMLYYKHKS